MRRALLIALSCLALAFAAPVVYLACGSGDSVSKGCQVDEDCPRPDRQTCVVETGICVGFTSPPGQVDGGDNEGIDAAVSPPPPE